MNSLKSRVPRSVWRVLVAIVGSIVLLAGIIMIPYPGPGWVVVFVGLAILAQEFAWARRLLRYSKARYDTWLAWAKKQSPIVGVLLFIGTCIVVILTIWLLNGYGLLNSWLHLDQDWVNSPFVRK